MCRNDTSLAVMKIYPVLIFKNENIIECSPIYHNINSLRLQPEFISKRTDYLKLDRGAKALFRHTNRAPRVLLAQTPITTSPTRLKQRIVIISKSGSLCVIIATLFYSASLTRGSWSPTRPSNRG